MKVKHTGYTFCIALAAAFVIGSAATTTGFAAQACTEQQLGDRYSRDRVASIDDTNLGTNRASVPIQDAINQLNCIQSQIDSRYKDVAEKIAFLRQGEGSSAVGGLQNEEV